MENVVSKDFCTYCQKKNHHVYLTVCISSTSGHLHNVGRSSKSSSMTQQENVGLTLIHATNI